METLQGFLGRTFPHGNARPESPSSTNRRWSLGRGDVNRSALCRNTQSTTLGHLTSSRRRPQLRNCHEFRGKNPWHPWYRVQRVCHATPNCSIDVYSYVTIHFMHESECAASTPVPGEDSRETQEDRRTDHYEKGREPVSPDFAQSLKERFIDYREEQKRLELLEAFRRSAVKSSIDSLAVPAEAALWVRIIDTSVAISSGSFSNRGETGRWRFWPRLWASPSHFAVPEIFYFELAHVFYQVPPGGWRAAGCWHVS